jgi:DNA replication initiation complex subunit (GINS family)
MNFALMQYHKYTLEDIENMIPFEREIYVSMLVQFLEEEKQRLESK